MVSINDQKKQEKLNQGNNNADDTKLLCSDKSEDDCQHIQKDLAILDDWAIKIANEIQWQ